MPMQTDMKLTADGAHLIQVGPAWHVRQRDGQLFVVLQQLCCCIFCRDCKMKVDIELLASWHVDVQMVASNFGCNARVGGSLRAMYRHYHMLHWPADVFYSCHQFCFTCMATATCHCWC